MNKIAKFFTSSEMDLTSGNTRSLIKKFLMFTLPILLVGVLELLYNSFDLIVVQQHDGAIYGAAVGANGSLIALITNALMGLSIGVNVVVSRYYGKKDKEGASNAAHTGILIAFIGGIILAIIGFFLSRQFLILMNVNEQYLDISSNYLKIYFLSMPFMMVYNFGASVFKGIGDSIKPLIFLLISGIVNVGLNYMFVYAFNLKEVGVALGTVISQALSAILIIVFLYTNKGFINLRFKNLKFHKHELLKILQIGIPSGLEGVIFSISNVLLQASVNAWPPDVVTANTDAANIESYTYTSMYAVASATPAFISANFGRGFKENVKKIHIISLITTFLVGFILGYTSYLLSDQLLKIYMGSNFDVDIVKYAKERMIVVLSTYFLCGLMDTETSVLRGLGHSIIPTVFTFFGCCVFRIIWDKFVYSPVEGNPMHSLAVLYMCYPISWLFSFSLQLVSYFIIKKKWMKRCDENLIKFEKRYMNKQEDNQSLNIELKSQNL